MRRLGVTELSPAWLHRLLLDTLERLAKQSEVRSIRIPVESYSPQYKAYQKSGFSVEADRTFSTVFAGALQPIRMRKLVA